MCAGMRVVRAELALEGHARAQLGVVWATALDPTTPTTSSKRGRKGLGAMVKGFIALAIAHITPVRLWILPKGTFRSGPRQLLTAWH